MQFSPVTLEGVHVRLVPLSTNHHADLCAAGLDEEIWRWCATVVRSKEEMLTYIETALKHQTEGTALPFAIVSRTSGRAIGSSRFGNIEADHRRVEIGWTWIGVQWQRTPVNTEAKFLMLKHGFENLGCLRVEFKTDVLNRRSRQALVRIGAKEEGVLRNHMITTTGRVRDTVYYSIIDSEWPAVKLKLVAKLERPFHQG